MAHRCSRLKFVVSQHDRRVHQGSCFSLPPCCTLIKLLWTVTTHNDFHHWCIHVRVHCFWGQPSSNQLYNFQLPLWAIIIILLTCTMYMYKPFNEFLVEYPGFKLRSVDFWSCVSLVPPYNGLKSGDKITWPATQSLKDNIQGRPSWFISAYCTFFKFNDSPDVHECTHISVIAVQQALINYMQIRQCKCNYERLLDLKQSTGNLLFV